VDVSYVSYVKFVRYKCTASHCLHVCHSRPTSAYLTDQLCHEAGKPLRRLSMPSLLRLGLVVTDLPTRIYINYDPCKLQCLHKYFTSTFKSWYITSPSQMASTTVCEQKSALIKCFYLLPRSHRETVSMVLKLLWKSNGVSPEFRYTYIIFIYLFL
jgi:hypothetical protein